MKTRYVTITSHKGGMKLQEDRKNTSPKEFGFQKTVKFTGALLMTLITMLFVPITVSEELFDDDFWDAAGSPAIEWSCASVRPISTVIAETTSAEAEEIEPVLPESELPEHELPEPVLPDPENPVIVLESLDVPADINANRGTKTFMSYKATTSPSSAQYAMQQDAWTDENGFRRYGDYYMVALGTFYAKSCGETFLITLDTGVSFKAVTGDIKSDKHTDSLHQHRNGNIVEFIVDSKLIPKMCRIMGDMSYTNDFSGRIGKIEKIVDPAYPAA